MKYRVLVLMHEDLVPPDNANEFQGDELEFAPWITEYNVIEALKGLGHEVQVLGVYSDLAHIRHTLEEFKPHVTFNLLEEFDGEVLFDQNVVSFLEMLRVNYTGCNPRGLMIARDKAIAKKLLSYHRIPTPKFQVFGKSRPKKLAKKIKFPLIVKCLYQEASLGLSGASVVSSEEKLYERIDYLTQKYKTDVIVEEFIEGREFYVGVMGNKRLQVLPVWELKFENSDDPNKEFYSEKAKWDKSYRERKGVSSQRAQLNPELAKIIIKTVKKTYKTLELSGYARVDIRLSNEGIPYILEANPNPNIAKCDEFAMSAKAMGLSYEEMISKILKIGLST
ncbi:ATP-grasp domain-containing protein [Bacteriovorax sp. DB6_IX]|uniref:D-alanine--D-alanine ligase family protein n=1 Tax=Bacteriovorax sp. DB6_IX TaxID=1353530 RepID=UPI001E487B4A|nr:ATP-grasp domain-containing protein [Bacteriovorax sp. DB6_IX]